MNNYLRQPIKRKKGLRRVSKRRAKENKEYAKLVAKLLAERLVCEAWLARNGWEYQGGIGEDAWYRQASWFGWIDADALQLLSRGAPRSTTCHHSRGRGRYFLDYSTFKALSMAGHRWVEENPSEAIELGLTSPLKNVRSSFLAKGTPLPKQG